MTTISATFAPNYRIWHVSSRAQLTVRKVYLNSSGVVFYVFFMSQVSYSTGVPGMRSYPFNGVEACDNSQ